MRRLFRTAAPTCLLLLAAAAPTTMPASTPTSMPASMPTTAPSAALDWSEAAKHVGETVTVTGPVKGTHAAGSRLVLNVGKDYPAADRFTILMPADAAAGSPDDLYVGKTVTVTGRVQLYRNVPEIVVKAAADVTVKP